MNKSVFVTLDSGTQAQSQTEEELFNAAWNLIRDNMHSSDAGSIGTSEAVHDPVDLGPAPLPL